MIFRNAYVTLLHRYTSKCVMRYKIMTERNMVNLTITMTKEERKALKQLALATKIGSEGVNLDKQAFNAS